MKSILIILSILSTLILTSCGSDNPDTLQKSTPSEKFAEGKKIQELDTSSQVQVAKPSGAVQVSESTVGGIPRLPPQ